MVKRMQHFMQHRATVLRLATLLHSVARCWIEFDLRQTFVQHHTRFLLLSGMLFRVTIV